MIIKKFIEQVERFYEKPAIKKGDLELSYGQLNDYADRIARAIITGDNPTTPTTQTITGEEQQQAALLFEHGIGMIAALLGVLKACKTYVPLDISYPIKRQLYILENSEARLLLTNNLNIGPAQEIAGQMKMAGREIRILNIDCIEEKIPHSTFSPVEREANGDRNAYIIYTSGSTGQPKGVYQTHHNVLYYTRNWIQRFSITPGDRMTLLTSFTHDGCVQDIFSALLSGACLYPYSLKEGGSIEGLYMLLVKEKITIWHSVPSLYRFFAYTFTEKDLFYDLRWILLGGEPLRDYDLRLYRDYFPQARLANVYGQTESSVSAICSIGPKDTFEDMHLGAPLDETKIMLVNDDGQIVEKMGGGEIVVSSAYLAPGYWQDPENSDIAFTFDDELGRLYWTGDQGRLTAEGHIKIMGRKDFQVKVRGFRVETGEIETALLTYETIKEVAVTARPDNAGDNYLCAYIVSTGTLTADELRKYLTAELPDYMVPRYFLFLEKMPLNFTGKIDRQSLPDPEEINTAESTYEAPTDEVEEKVAAIWQEVLAVEKVGINDNFIQLGGHSLLVISIIARIHQEFDVELQLIDVFSKPTVKELAQLIRRARPSLFSPIEPAEEKEYYPVTADQARMFILNRMEEISITYNTYAVRQVEGKIDRDRFQHAFQKLIERHESFRTSFEMLADEQPVQLIHKQVSFQVSYMNATVGKQAGAGDIDKIIKNFVRPFDLSKPPLLRVCLIKTSDDNHILIMDIHHIVSDGVSEHIVINDFARLYQGEELPPVRLRYRDYSEWQCRQELSEQWEKAEKYWLEMYKNAAPILDLPTDYPRPAVQEFEGDLIKFQLDQDITQQLNKMARATGATLYIVLLAIYNVLLNKYTGCPDIVVGSFIAGRDHADMQHIVGLLVKTIALRNSPSGNKTFQYFLQEVKNNTLQAFENQQYPFNHLLEKLNLPRDPSRNPLFDTAFILQNIGTAVPQENERSEELRIVSYDCEIRTAKFDLTFEAFDGGDSIPCCFNYCTRLFKQETIELMKERFLILTQNILNNPNAAIQDLDMALPIEHEIAQKEEIGFDL